ncbi:hypothetical protein CYMTET_23331 [Cymbomonas tetramitiformis]|uniref:Uncharacterized protein n=1 Tax=Cymbomonas tetramitiformis TaxID=36881 RepID=A0AAE0FYQ5_9CHLO|nr:hypothetical protein CYMTET_23331 [Cymbomonas tetramitiformis]
MAVAQTVFVTTYALFLNFQKFNKALAVACVGLVAAVVQRPQVKAMIRSVLWVLRQCYLSVVFWCRWLRSAILGQEPSELRTEREKLLADVHLVSPLETHLQKVAYFLILGSWFIIAWSLFTYAMLIRKMMGPAEENEMIVVWITTLVVEMFGAETLKLIAIKLLVEELIKRVEEFFTGVDISWLWFEEYIMTVVATNTMGRDGEVEQDMGDDADADGGDGLDNDDQMDVMM